MRISRKVMVFHRAHPHSRHIVQYIVEVEQAHNIAAAAAPAAAAAVNLFLKSLLWFLKII